jgi:hypothetical protein
LGRRRCAESRIRRLVIIIAVAKEVVVVYLFLVVEIVSVVLHGAPRSHVCIIIARDRVNVASSFGIRVEIVWERGDIGCSFDSRGGGHWGFCARERAIEWCWKVDFVEIRQIRKRSTVEVQVQKEDGGWLEKGEDKERQGNSSQ